MKFIKCNDSGEIDIRVINHVKGSTIINDLGFIEIIKWYNGKTTIRWVQLNHRALSIQDLKAIINKMENLTENDLKGLKKTY